MKRSRLVLAFPPPDEFDAKTCLMSSNNAVFINIGEEKKNRNEEKKLINHDKPRKKTLPIAPFGLYSFEMV